MSRGLSVRSGGGIWRSITHKNRFASNGQKSFSAAHLGLSRADCFVYDGPMLAVIGRYFKPRQLLVGGNEIIDFASFGNSATPSCDLKRPGPDIPIDLHGVFVWPPFRSHVCILEGFVDVAVVEQRDVVHDAAI